MAIANVVARVKKYQIPEMLHNNGRLTDSAKTFLEGQINQSARKADMAVKFMSRMEGVSITKQPSGLYVVKVSSKLGSKKDGSQELVCKSIW